MLKITDEDQAFLTKHISNAAVLLESNQLDTLLELLDGFMTEQGYQPQDYQELNDLGTEAEHVLDRLYYAN